MDSWIPPFGAALTRREMLRSAGAASMASILSVGCSRNKSDSTSLPPLVGADDPILRFPGKVPMRVINDRPPCLETPWRYYRDDITPNDAFYVRWHLQVIPTSVDSRIWRLKVGGHVEKPLEYSLEQLKQLPPASVVAVNQCSGNSRGLFGPRVLGAQWANGAMGNAKWTGVPLRELLRLSGVKAGALQVSFDGLDEGPLPSVPDYIKTLNLDHALSREPLIAYAMNDQPIPLLNGFPARLIVPGWYATYWMKSLSQINVLSQKFDGFWMAKAYRIPTTPNALELPTALAKETVPISRMNIRSFVTTPDRGARIPVNQPCALDGIAFDGGDGIKSVEISADGTSWQAATLGNDLGKFSFRRWRCSWTPSARGEVKLRVRATSNSGETQPTEAGWNRSGYMRNVIEEWPVTVV